jgi:hypothetical protein
MSSNGPFDFMEWADKATRGVRAMFGTLPYGENLRTPSASSETPKEGKPSAVSQNFYFPSAEGAVPKPNVLNQATSGIFPGYNPYKGEVLPRPANVTPNPALPVAPAAPIIEPRGYPTGIDTERFLREPTHTPGYFAKDENGNIVPAFFNPSMNNFTFAPVPKAPLSETMGQYAQRMGIPSSVTNDFVGPRPTVTPASPFPQEVFRRDEFGNMIPMKSMGFNNPNIRGQQWTETGGTAIPTGPTANLYGLTPSGGVLPMGREEFNRLYYTNPAEKTGPIETINAMGPGRGLWNFNPERGIVNALPPEERFAKEAFLGQLKTGEEKAKGEALVAQAQAHGVEARKLADLQNSLGNKPKTQGEWSVDFIKAVGPHWQMQDFSGKPIPGAQEKLIEAAGMFGELMAKTNKAPSPALPMGVDPLTSQLKSLGWNDQQIAYYKQQKGLK